MAEIIEENLKMSIKGPDSLFELHCCTCAREVKENYKTSVYFYIICKNAISKIFFSL